MVRWEADALETQPFHGRDGRWMTIGGAFAQDAGKGFEADAGALGEGMGAVVVDLDAGLAHEDAMKIGADGHLRIHPAAVGIGDDGLAGMAAGLLRHGGRGKRDQQAGEDECAHLGLPAQWWMRVRWRERFGKGGAFWCG